MVNQAKECKAAERKIASIIAARIGLLLDYSAFVRNIPVEEFRLTRPQLNFIKAQTEHAEELLDGFGARGSRLWFPFRETVALLKNFSGAAHELLHVRFASRYYNLGEQLQVFQQATETHSLFQARVLHRALCDLLEQAQSLDLPHQPQTLDNSSFQEIASDLRLPYDRRLADSGDSKNQVDSLAITILNSTEEVNNFRNLAKAKPEEWNKLDFDFISERRFRGMEVNMHVLQSMYDTYIANSEMETAEEILPVLRGHISATVHLLRVATLYIHFYERHLRSGHASLAPQDTALFRSGIVKYLAYYLWQFLANGRKLCSSLLKKYCVEKTVQVKVPPYIGFHVRPSSLVAAIVAHYGCNVTMSLDDSAYDASIFANIAMANNYIDQKKRAFISAKINELDLSEYERQIQAEVIDRLTATRQIILSLAARDYLRIYKLPLCIGQLPQGTGGSLQSIVFETIKYLMNTDRQIGINYDVTVSFTGPKQAVDDIACLAEANYCESERGEDLPLPRQLDYLNFKRRTLRRKP